MMFRNFLSARRMMACAAGIFGGINAMVAPAVGAEPMTFDTVLAALQSGKTVKILTDLGQCSTSDNKPGPPLQGGLQINAFIVVPGQGILFSDTHQTLEASGQTVTEFIRYRLGSDNKVTVAFTRQTAAGIVSQDPLVCGLSNGARFVW
jgi:hypothetical protein